jgi:riboflavin biosynthesis pyrimidine reductase
MIYCSESAAKHHAWASIGEVSIRRVKSSPEGGLDLFEILKDLNGNSELGRPITQLLVEPGPMLARSFFRDNLVDRVWVFQSKMCVNNDTAPAAALIPGEYVNTGELTLAGDTLTEYLNPRSVVFFAGVASADLVSSQSG